MSNVEELQAKVAKAEERVEKCKRTIERHKKQLEKLKANGGHEYDIESKEDDIKRSTQKLEDAQEVLNNWKNKLKIAVEKQRFIEDKAPQVIKDFLETWKKNAFDWHIQRHENYLEYKKKLAGEVEAAQLNYIMTSPDYADRRDENGNLKQEFRWIISVPNRGMEKHLKELELDYRSVKKKEMEYAGAVVMRMCDFYNKADMLKWLDKELEREKVAKMLDLIQRITKVVGTITDASYLRISPKGNLDGYIIGTEGKAMVETIGAGGHTIQCFHFRTLVHPM